MVPEPFTLGGGQFDLAGAGLAATVTGRKSACAPGGTTSDLVQGALDLEGGGVTEGDVDHALVNPGRKGIDAGGFLASTGGRGADEEAKVLAVQRTRHPQLAELVDEGLPLGRVGAVTGGDPEQERIVGLEDVRGDEGDRGVLRGGVHLAQHFLREGLFDSVTRVSHDSSVLCHPGLLRNVGGLCRHGQEGCVTEVDGMNGVMLVV